ncbi:DUF4249 family protein [Longibacter salinarum]|uniref:DUF4249 family protein n=1 Tax=Longibacter salinarum TaxID=1850348 RepID=UPI00318320E8
MARCDFVDDPSPSRLVVEAFLLSGEPLPEIVLRQTRGLRNPVPPQDSTADAATGAVVTVAIGSDTVAYLPGTTPGRYRPARPVIAKPGESFSVRVQWKGEVVTAAGTVPEPIGIGEACVRVPDDPVEAILVDSLRRDSLDIPAEQGYIFPIDVSVDWQDSTDDDSWVRTGIRPSSDFSSGVVELFLQPVEVDRESDFSFASGSASRRQWVGVYAVSAEDSTAPVPAHEITVSLTRGDSAFASFASSRTDPERREPVSNVDGGIGVATAVALDTLRLAVSEATSGEQCELP